MKIPVCGYCSMQGHYEYQCWKKPQKIIKTKKPLSVYNKRPITVKKQPRRISDKQADYHQWLEVVARPYLIKKFGNVCSCCGRPAHEGEKLDIEHTKPVGSNPHLKRDLENLTLMCRIPCHHMKTIGKACTHV